MVFVRQLRRSDRHLVWRCRKGWQKLDGRFIVLRSRVQKHCVAHGGLETFGSVGSLQ